MKADADLYVDSLSDFLAAPRLPVDPVAEVEALGQAIKDWQTTAGDRFDLQEAVHRQADLLETLRAVPWSKGAGKDWDLALIRLLRPLHRVSYVPLSPYHPDSGAISGPLPGLAPISTLAEEDSGTDRYRFAEATLIRERNRLLEALDIAAVEALRLHERIGPN